MTNDHDNGKQRAIFEGLSWEEPSILTISFASDPTASLGVQLSSHDTGLTNEMFYPGFASIGGILDGPTLAQKNGVRLGDIVVAVSGEGFRRFSPDFQDVDLEDVTTDATRDLINLSLSDELDPFALATEKEGGVPTKEEKQRRGDLKERVVRGKTSGEVYEQLLLKIREIKTRRIKNPANAVPLVLSLERYSWDSRVHSWSRFLSARNGNVPAAMAMIQGHGRWRNEFFPIDLTEPSLQKLLQTHTVTDIDIESDEGDNRKVPVVYIDFFKLQTGLDSQRLLMADLVKTFVMFTETQLSKSPDPRRPKTSQFVDLTGVSIKQGLQPHVLKQLYATFESNYPIISLQMHELLS